ncbi:MAG TPA: polysaccharide biosynthesis/export family protein [Candidatus Sulfotelmatobacter sp.]|nr:polysaccharide biosynthesis/export family protein [Candidatus Sulfotelmatobacter sp.]
MIDPARPYWPAVGRLLRLLALGLPAACGPVLQNPTPPTEVASAQAEFIAQPYRIRPGDMLEVKHRLATELNDVAVVRPDGKISLPLIPSTRAAGLTSDELEANLKQAYARDLRDVQLSVLVRSFSTQRVFVGGEVEKPGVLDMVDGETIMQALFAAGGMKSTARSNEVVVVRRGDADRRQIFAVNLDQVMSGAALGQDMPLEPLDTVIVPRSDIAQVDLWVEQYIRNLLPAAPSASVLYTFNNTPTGASTVSH